MADNDSEFGAFLVGFVLGGLVGAAVALLLAPQSGEETRKYISDKSIELKTTAGETAQQARERAEAAAAEARVRAEEFSKAAKERADEIKKRGQEVLEQQKSKIEKVIKKQPTAEVAPTEPPAEPAA